MANKKQAEVTIVLTMEEVMHLTELLNYEAESTAQNLTIGVSAHMPEDIIDWGNSIACTGTILLKVKQAVKVGTK